MATSPYTYVGNAFPGDGTTIIRFFSSEDGFLYEVAQGQGVLLNTFDLTRLSAQFRFSAGLTGMPVTPVTNVLTYYIEDTPVGEVLTRTPRGIEFEPAVGGGGGSFIVQDEGASMTTRSRLNFVGENVSVLDDPAGQRTNVVVNGGSGGLPTGGATNNLLVKTSGANYAAAWTSSPTISGLTMPTPGAAYARFTTLPGIPNWVGVTLNCSYNAGWILDDTSMPGWFFKLDTRAGFQQFAIWRVPAGANPHVDEAPLFTLDTSGLITVTNRITGLATPSGPSDAATKGYVDGQISGGGTPDATGSVKGKILLAGDLAGTADSPQIASGVITDAEISSANKDGSAGTPSLRTLGTGATQAMPGNTTVTAPDATTGTKGIVQLAGDLAGTAASPQIAAGVITDAEIASANKDGVAGTASMRTLGTGAQQATAGNDTRLSNARAPTTHATTHQPGGSDAMAVDAAAATGSLRTLGTGAAQATAGNDSRLSNARTPTSHASTHQPGGSDVMAVDAAAAVGSLRTLGTGATQAAAGNDPRFSTGGGIEYYEQPGDPGAVEEGAIWVDTDETLIAGAQVVVLTQAQYTALTPKDPGTVYVIT